MSLFPTSSLVIAVSFHHAPSFSFSPCRLHSLLSFPYLCHFFVLFFPSLLHSCVFAAAVRPCQDQVALKSWQGWLLPGFAGSWRMWSWDLNIHIFCLHSRGMEGEMKGGMLGTGASRWRQKVPSFGKLKKSQNDMTCFSLHLITTLMRSEGVRLRTEGCETQEKNVLWCGET